MAITGISPGYIVCVRTPTTTSDQKRAYSVAEVCAAAGISRATLYVEWQRGRGPRKSKLGKRTLVLREALEDWLAGLEIAPTVPSKASEG